MTWSRAHLPQLAVAAWVLLSSAAGQQLPQVEPTSHRHQTTPPAQATGPRVPGGRLAPTVPLALTEIMYHPADGGAEFLELANTSVHAISVAGVHFSDGIDFVFPQGSSVAPGGRVVIVSSEDDFATAYPDVSVAGVYSGRLSNAGETVTLARPDGTTLLSLRYDDDVPWPTDADGLGRSLVITDPQADPTDPYSWCTSVDLGGAPGQTESGTCPPRTDPTGAMFDPNHLLEVEIEMAAEDWEELRRQERNLLDIFADENCMAEPFESPYTYFPGTVRVDGVEVQSVGVRKKGFLGSLSRDKPSLKIRFDEYTAGQRLSGLRRMTLNNAQQDPSLMNQCLGYQLFSAAGVPAPRCSFAVVTVNGEDLGVYAHVESVRDRFLALHFDRNDGTLLEGTLSDFRPEWTGTFDAKNDVSDEAEAVLSAMVSAMEASDAELVAALEGLIDLDAFLTYWAMEVILAHWDGYASNTNNYFLYHDPDTHLFSFMPWGADALFIPESGAVMANGILAHRLYLNQPTRDAYVDRVLGLLDTVWNEPAILAEVDRMHDLLVDRVAPEQLDFFEQATQGIRTFVAGRRAEMEAELLPVPPPWTEPLMEPLCFDHVGEVAATFETTWGTLGIVDPILAGDGTLDVTINGDEIVTLQVGAAAGPGSDPLTRSQILIVATLGQWNAIALLIETDNDLLVPGATIEIDETPTIAYLFYVPAGGGAELVGLLANGTLVLDEAGTGGGDTLSGTVQAEVWAPFF